MDVIKQRENVAKLEGREVELEGRLAHLLAMTQEATQELADVRYQRTTIEERIAAKELQRL